MIEIGGWALWALGFAIEVTADRQKRAFAERPDSSGKFIQEGLWAWSRHPNYFGEILLWTGLFLSGLGHYRGGQWAVVSSPLLVGTLLGFVSGIPLLEKRADQRHGADPDYQAYKARTPVLLLRPPRRG